MAVMLTRRRFLKRSGAATLCALPGSPGAALEPAVPFLDSHVHVWKHDANFPFAPGSHAPAEDASAEMLIALMQANGVARTVLIQVIHYRWDNSYLVDVLRRYPTRFRGVCRVDPEDPAAPDQLSHWTEQGCHGVRLSPAVTAAGDWIRGPLMHPLWERCAKLRVPMTLLIPATRLSDVVPLLDRHADVTVVIDHMADCPLNRPDLLQSLLALRRYPHVFVKISHMWSLSEVAYPYPDAAEQVKRLYDGFGPNRLMAGTDWPIAPQLCTYPERIALFCDHLAFLGRGDREAVTSGTVQRVWPFPAWEATGSNTAM